MGRPAVVTKGMAIRIRELYLKGISMDELAFQFSISKTTVNSIISGRHAYTLNMPSIARPIGRRKKSELHL